MAAMLEDGVRVRQAKPADHDQLAPSGSAVGRKRNSWPGGASKWSLIDDRWLITNSRRTAAKPWGVRSLTGAPTIAKHFRSSLPIRTDKTLRRAFTNASNVESQESCIHPSLSETACARLVLRCSPLLSRHNHRKENGYKKSRSHVQSPTNSLPAPTRSRLGAQRTRLGTRALPPARVARYSLK